ncbi:MAG: LacI family DNA-binding transcriptional regulator [Roseburia sp.]|nr:LacI family DNA-binding transcriptional regulator [Roseburia sp.]MCM1241369.1 LacI family DNA-binding transcriptional regulator [Roseburia sp.]
MITVREIARECNVSPSTVSNILNGKTNASEETRQKVLKAVKELGYQPNFFAQSMRKQNSRIIGVITEDLKQFSTVPIVESVMAYCEDHDYRSILMNLRLYDKWCDTWFGNEEKLKTVLEPVLREAMSIRVDGLLYVAGHGRVINVFPDDLPIPLVVAYSFSGNEKYPSVVIDDEKGGYDMTRYLITRGHTKIGLIAGIEGNVHTQSRLKGYQRALFESNILYDPELVQYGDWFRESGYRAAEYLLQNGVTALFCMNDIMAAGAYDFIEEKNFVIGKDISVAGYDDRDIAAYFRPRLTTNAIPLREIGQKSAETLLDLLKTDEKKEAVSQVIRIPCKVLERDSVS